MTLAEHWTEITFGVLVLVALFVMLYAYLYILFERHCRRCPWREANERAVAHIENLGQTRDLDLMMDGMKKVSSAYGVSIGDTPAEEPDVYDDGEPKWIQPDGSAGDAPPPAEEPELRSLCHGLCSPINQASHIDRLGVPMCDKCDPLPAETARETQARVMADFERGIEVHMHPGDKWRDPPEEGP